MNALGVNPATQAKVDTGAAAVDTGIAAARQGAGQAFDWARHTQPGQWVQNTAMPYMKNTWQQMGPMGRGAALGGVGALGLVWLLRKFMGQRKEAGVPAGLQAYADSVVQACETRNIDADALLDKHAAAQAVADPEFAEIYKQAQEQTGVGAQYILSPGAVDVISRQGQARGIGQGALGAAGLIGASALAAHYIKKWRKSPTPATPAVPAVPAQGV